MQKIKVDSTGARGVYTVCEVENGVPHGRYLEFDVDTGNVVRDCTYVDGRREGLVKTFYPDGKLKSTVNFSANVQDGPYVEYFPNGERAATAFYVAGLCQGTSMSFYSDGAVKATFNFVDDELDGMCTEYYEGGQVKSSFSYLKGQMHGVCSQFYENGHIQATATYKNGKMDGFVDFWYESGVLKSRVEYKNGNQVSEKVVWYDVPETIVKIQMPKGKKKKVFYENGKEVDCTKDYNSQVVIATFASIVNKFDLAIECDAPTKYTRKKGVKK